MLAAVLAVFEFGLIGIPYALPILLGLGFLHLQSLQIWMDKLPRGVVAVLATTPIVIAIYVLILMTGCYESACSDEGSSGLVATIGSVALTGLILAAMFEFLGVAIIGSLIRLWRALSGSRSEVADGR